MTTVATDSLCAVACSQLGVRFGDYQALENITLETPAGSFVTLIGPNGAGKSTLLKVLLGVVTPTTGAALLYGQPPQAVGPFEVGYVPQIKTLDRRFPALARELVATGLLARWPWRLRGELRAQCEAALERTGTHHLSGRAIGHLSGGELQRVYLARAMVRRPRLVLLDEPAAGMDVSGEADMYEILEQYQQETGATIIMITHDWEAAQYHASHVLLINRHLIGFGAPNHALRDENLRRAFGHLSHRHRLTGEIGQTHPHHHTHS
jgi:zinc transport system ATP-binding protein